MYVGNALSGEFPPKPLRRALAALLPLAAALAVCPGTAWGQPALTSIGTFQSPVYVTAPPGDSHRLMVVERAGRVRLIKDGKISSAPFLDISSSVDARGEGGLLSIAFPPNYAKSGRFYAFYTDSTGVRVAEFRASNRDRAKASTRRILLTLPQSVPGGHYAGQLQFGPDGRLYISIGDGGPSGDPNGRAQDLGTWWGKILRINPLPSKTSAYGVPPDNPFLATTGAKPEIWSYGLRNPWRFSLDRQTGDLVIGDVGHSTVDEVHFATAPNGRGRGANFGWNCFEGSRPYAGAPATCTTPPPSDPVWPVLETAHPATAIGGFCQYSITGGYIVRNAPSSLNGRYVYGDYCSGEVRSVRLTTTGASEDRATGIDLPDLTLVSFGEDASGRIYAASLKGPVYRIGDSTGYASTIQGTSGLVSYWRLDESSGTTATDSTGAASGTYAGGFSLGQPGAIARDSNTAVSFDGSSGQMSAPANAGGAQGTIEFWGYASDLGSRNGVVYTADNGQTTYSHQIGVRSDGSVRLYLWDGSRRTVTSAAGLVGANQWHHYALTWVDSDSAILYVDGVNRGSVPIGSSWKRGSKLIFGAAAGAPSELTNPWQGRIDEPATYNTALSAATVQQHYTAGHGP